MPRWLKNQLRNAYLDKDTRLVRLLNDCWFFYRKQEYDDQTSQIQEYKLQD